MVIALVLMTLAVCIAIDFIRTRNAAHIRERRPAEKTLPSATQVFERYFHPGHSWAMMEGSKPVTLGADDIVQRFMARLDRVEVPEPGTEVRQGDPLVTFHQGKRSLTLVSPLSGTLTEVNDRLSSRPVLLRESPYDKGWVARIKPSNLQIELHNLLRGALAERWREGVQAQIAAWFSPRLGVVLQDGGQWIEDLGSLVQDDEWDSLAQTLFFVAPMQSGNKS